MAQRIGLCAFCGRQGSLTKQHVIPDRLKKIVPRQVNTHTQTLLRLERFGQHLIPVPTVVKQKSGHSGTRKVRRVCLQCNTKWMRQIEEESFPLLAPYIQGSTEFIREDVQRCIANIAALIASVADLDDPSNSGVSKEERDYLRQNRTPPPHWHVFIGRVDSVDWETKWRHFGCGLFKSDAIVDPSNRNTQGTTIGMGKILLQVISMPPEIGILDREALSRDCGLAQIFPYIEQLEVVSLPVHDSASAFAVADRFYRGLISTMRPPSNTAVLP
jgi:hypothetical protein